MCSFVDHIRNMFQNEILRTFKEVCSLCLSKLAHFFLQFFISLYHYGFVVSLVVFLWTKNNKIKIDHLRDAPTRIKNT